MKEHYYSNEYDHKARWMTFYFQINEVRKQRPRKTLEIGLGSGVVQDYLKKRFNHTTVDIDPDLKPDIVANVLDLPFKDKEFDVVLCCEVLEHLPFENFRKALREIGRVGKVAVISLPDHRRTLINFWIKLPLLKKFNLFIKIPSFQTHIFDGQHYWEIGKRGFPPQEILREMESVGFVIEKHFVPNNAPTTHFFILK